MGGFSIFLAIVALVIILIAVGSYYEKKRQEALGEFAERHNMVFTVRDDGTLMSRCSCFPLFGRGRSRRIRNILSCNRDGVDYRLFQYSFRTGGGKNSTTHNYTICFVQHTSRDVPSFTLSPEGFFSRIGHALGGQDIDFESHENFSKRWVLKGDDEMAIRQFFSAQRLEFFGCLSQRFETVSTHGDLLMMARNGSVAMKNYAEFHEECAQVVQAVAGQSPQIPTRNSPFIIEE